MRVVTEMLKRLIKPSDSVSEAPDLNNTTTHFVSTGTCFVTFTAKY